MGAELTGKILIIDDVITAGTAVREVITIIEDNGAEAAGVVIGLNRQERGNGELSAIQEVERDYKVRVISIVDLSQIVDYLTDQEDQVENVAKIEAYRKQYGV